MDVRDKIISAAQIFQMIGITEKKGRALRYRINAGRAPRDSLPPLTTIGGALVCFESVFNQWMQRRAAVAMKELDTPYEPQRRGRPRSS